MTRGVALAMVGGGLLAVGAAAGLALTERGGGDPAPAAPAVMSAATIPQEAWLDARTKGSADAPIVIYEVGDFQCPACRTFWEETLPGMTREYIETGKVRLTFINLPLVSIHPNAPAAHELAMCAAQQDRFWPVHDLLYQHQDEWARLNDPREYLLGLAERAELDAGALTACLESGAMMAMLESEANSAIRAGVRSTPSFVVERTLLPGAAPMEAWRPILDSIYAAKTAATGGR